MLTFKRSSINAMLTLTVAVLFSGCATTVEKKVNIFYEPSASATGGSGDLYLVQGIRPIPKEAADIQFVLGDIKDKDGDKLGNVVTDMAPANLVLDALRQELKAAGYHVVAANTVPAKPGKALSLESVTVKLDEVHSFVKDEANCSVGMSVQPWRNGSAVNTLSYEAEYSDTAVADRDLLLSKTLQKTLQLLMKRSVPETVRIIEQR